MIIYVYIRDPGVVYIVHAQIYKCQDHDHSYQQRMLWLFIGGDDYTNIYCEDYSYV